MSSHLRHVRHLLDEGRFPWAHAYVDRLIAEAPGDSESLLLKAMILERQGRPFEETVRQAEALGGHYVPMEREDPPPPRAVSWLGPVFIVTAVSAEVVGESALGLDDLPMGGLVGLLAAALVSGAVAAAVIRGHGLRVGEVVRGQVRRSRAFYARLDERNLRHHAGSGSLLLYLATILCALGPRMVPFMGAEVARFAWPLLVWTAVAAFAWIRMGAALPRALRVSGVVQVNVVLAVALTAAPVWALGACLVTLPWVIASAVTLRREGALQRRPR
ncbi:hypothetical protein [Nonomuraea roseola]|uniref:Tetratricopeptide repeat protein n=1 Tax=Nonomuraea roseola TaxID=46179 RepID=A0ABV5PYV1_9ACTN